MKMNEINPENEQVLVSIDLPEEVKDGVFIGGVKNVNPVSPDFYVANVIKLGETSSRKDECPNLKVNEKVIISQFAGTLTPVTDSYVKVVRGSDIIAKLKNKDMGITKENVEPTGDRILIKIVPETSMTEDGIFVDSTTNDDVIAGKGFVVNPGNTEFKVGTEVYFDPYAGNMISVTKDYALKTIFSFDILFSIKS